MDKTTQLSPEAQTDRLTQYLAKQGFLIDNVAFYWDGFSFTASNELDAYKLAYLYRRNSKDTIVSPCPNLGEGIFLIQVYHQ